MNEILTTIGQWSGHWNLNYLEFSFTLHLENAKRPAAFWKLFVFFLMMVVTGNSCFFYSFHNMFRINCKKGLNLRLFKAKKNIFRNVKYFKPKKLLLFQNSRVFFKFQNSTAHCVIITALRKNILQIHNIVCSFILYILPIRKINFSCKICIWVSAALIPTLKNINKML